MSQVLRHLPSFLGPGLLLFLVSVQIACAMSGFEASDGVLGLLEVPGVLLGWGGVVLLLPILAWLVLDWWGYSPSGFAMKSLGGIALGIATSGLAGLVGGRAGGGVVGADLASMLRDNVGTAIAVFVLLLMAVPAAILAFARLGLGRPSAPRAAAPAPSAAPDPARPREPRGASAWLSGVAAKLPRKRPRVTTDLEALARRNAGGRMPYPAPRYDAAGNELPMAFEGSRDVGAIRFADDHADPPVSRARGVPPGASAVVPGSDGLPTIRDVLSGNANGADGLVDAAPSSPTYDDVESEIDEPDDDGPIHVDAHGRPVSRAKQPPAPSAASKPRRVAPELRPSRDAAAEPDVVHLPEAGPPASLLLARDRTDNESDALPPDVRFAESPNAAAVPAAKAPPAPVTPEPVLEALKGTTAQRVANRRADERTPETRAEEMRTVRSSVRRTLAPVTDDGANEVHLRKLEASGLFASPTDDATAGPSASGGPASAAAPPPLPDVSPARLAAQKALLHHLRSEGCDPHFADAVEVALDAGAVSVALLARRLGTSPDRSHNLLERLIATDVVAAPGPSGTCVTVLTRDQWNEIRT